MPQITGLDVTCEKTGMVVNLQFSAPFNGVVFSKGHFSNPSCRYVKRNSDRSNVVLTVPLSTCGTQTVESSSDRLMLENTVVIQADPMVQDSWDSARKITCDWQSKLEKMVTFAPIGVSDLLQVAEIKFAGSGDNVRTRMEIQFGRGPFAHPLEGLTKIGDELTVVVYAEDGGAGYDVLVKNCFAYDGRNFKSANKIRLLNEHGCLFRPHQMEYFKRTFDTRSTGADIIAFARMNAFKFPDKMDVYLSCELEMCKGGCDTHCEMSDYPIDIIEALGPEFQPGNQRQEVEAATPITTFRPEKSRKVVKGVTRRRKPKKFGTSKVEDVPGNLLNPPVTLSPEIMELLEELGADEPDSSNSINRPFRGNSNNLDTLRPSSTGNRQQHNLVASAEPHASDDFEAQIPLKNNFINDNSITSGFPQEENASGKLMSFSTIFAGTHTTSDTIPQQITQNDGRFQPSQLLSAAITENSGLFTDKIRTVSKGNKGTNPARFPPKIPEPQPEAFVSPAQTNSNPPMQNQNNNGNVNTNQITPALLRNSPQIPNINPSSASQLMSSRSFSSAVNPNSIDSRQTGSGNFMNKKTNQGGKVNTLQQHLRTEGQFLCNSKSSDPKCNPKSDQINIGGFHPVSTNPNSLSPTVIFTSPRSVEKFQKQMSLNPNQPKEVLIKILDSQSKSNPISQQIRNNRPKFGTRIPKNSNSNKFSHFFGSKRKRRDEEWASNHETIRNVFADSETVNMVKGFQVVSAADLAFDPKTLRDLDDSETLGLDTLVEEDICFPETSFYAGLLVVCSLLMISGTVSVCSIRQVRKHQRGCRSKKTLFGSGGSCSDPYH